MSTYRQLFKSTGLLGSVQALYILIAVVRNKVAAQLIGAAGMGLADLYARTLDLVGGSTNFGLGMSAIKTLSEQTDGETAHLQRALQVRRVRTWVALTALLGFVVCLLFSPLISLTACGSMERTGDFCLLSPAVALATLAGGEVAVLKAQRQLKRLARATLWSALFTLAACLVLYGRWGVAGVLPMLVCSAAGLFAFNLLEARKSYAYRIGPFSRVFLRAGLPMLRMGLAFMTAAVMTAGAEMIIRAALMRTEGGLATIGYYAAGFTLTVSYARIVFVAMDADFFPRLSAIPAVDVRKANLAINRQINTLVVLMAPFLMVFSLFLPWIIRLLYTADFLVIMPMVLCAAPYMFFKAVYTPVAYLPLARGHSLRYMYMELAYDVVFCLGVIGGYCVDGLQGAGVGLAAANLFDLLFISFCYRRHYGFRMSMGTLKRCLFLFVILLVNLWVASQTLPLLHWLGGMLCLACSVPYVWPVLRKIRK